MRVAEKEELRNTNATSHGFLFRFAFAVSGNRTDGQAIVQEVGRRVLSQSMNTDQSLSEKVWLARMVLQIADAIDNQKSKNDFSGFELPFPMEDDKLFDVLELPSIYRNPMYLFYYEDFSVEQIADILDVPQNTVTLYLRWGRDELSIITGRKQTKKAEENTMHIDRIKNDTKHHALSHSSMQTKRKQQVEQPLTEQNTIVKMGTDTFVATPYEENKSIGTENYRYCDFVNNTNSVEDIECFKETELQTLSYEDADYIKVCPLDGYAVKTKADEENRTIYVEFKYEDGSKEAYLVDMDKLSDHHQSPVLKAAGKTMERLETCKS